MKWHRSPTVLALVAAASPALAEDAGQPSEYRPDVMVERLYKQQIDDVYFTTWFGRLEKSEGAWRDVYIETGEKYVNKGLISFNCAPKADIGLILYDVGDFGVAADRRIVRVRFADRKAWAAGRFKPLWGETPPYELYLAARQRFCK